MKKILALLILIVACALPELRAQSEKDWVSLFNGKNLSGWDIKIAGHELNDNYNETFRFEDGMIDRPGKLAGIHFSKNRQTRGVGEVVYRRGNCTGCAHCYWQMLRKQRG